MNDSGQLVVTQIIGGLSIGGAEKHFVSLLNQLDSYERHAIFLGKELGGPTLNAQLNNGIEQVRHRIRKRSALLGVMTLAKLLARQRCDVVHTHMFWANLYGSIAARLAGVPVIVTTEHGENRWKKAHHHWLERKVISKIADKRYCVSKSILERRRDDDGVPADKLELVANGTAVPKVPVHFPGRAEPVIGSIGRFVKQKDFELFVDVVSTLRSRGNKVRGCIVGDGPEMERVKEKVANAGLEAVIELPGMTTETDKWFRSFDIYLMTSREEGLPVSLLEAMSYGLPVVASNVGAVSTAIRTEEEGSLVCSGNESQFVTAVSKYLDDMEYAMESGAKARERIIQDFSIHAISARYESDYVRLLEQKKAFRRTAS